MNVLTPLAEEGGGKLHELFVVKVQARTLGEAPAASNIENSRNVRRAVVSSAVDAVSHRSTNDE